MRTLEELGIGRPSTYASILGTILDRGYVFKKGTALVPSFLAFSVVSPARAALRQARRLRLHRARWRTTSTASPPARSSASTGCTGSTSAQNDGKGLQELVSDLGAIDAKEINSIRLDGDSGIVIRVGRYGPYLERGEQRANIPDDLVPDELTVEKADELLDQPSGDRDLGTHPETGREIVARTGRYGPYVTEVLEEGSKEKPRTASLFKSMSLDTITLDDALQLLALPRVLGDGADGEEVSARNGRYGPYAQHGKETRSLESEEQLLTITLEEAQALLAQPRERRGRGQAKPPLKELGPDPVRARRWS